jgi:SAM-dependent methyltransferase
LRGLAEQFSDLDPAFRSHEKMKIGVAGLPKRIILASFGDYYSGHGAKKLQDVIRAINTFMERPQIEWHDFNRWCSFHNGLRDFEQTRYSENEMVHHEGTVLIAKRYIKAGAFNVEDWNVWTDPMPDLEVRIFKNGNAHIHFAKPLMNAVNLAIAEYYGEVLPDCPEAATAEKRASTDLCKDLQFFATPAKVADRLCTKSHLPAGEDGTCRILEPSCGEGAIMEAVQRYSSNDNNSYYCQVENRRKFPQISIQGIECDEGRAATARSKGFPVQAANFLQVKPEPLFDVVLMNPPFYRKHYQAHVEHGLKFLKPGGVLYAVLPESAAGAHAYVERPTWGCDKWEDLPVGSFSTSGTNINTGIARFFAPK